MSLPQYGGKPDPNQGARLLLGLIPESVRKSASPAEITRRITEAQRLGAQATDMKLDPLLRRESKERAQAVLAAPVPVRKVAPVAKAKPKQDPDNPMVPVFDQDGNLLGVCNESDLTPVAGSKKPEAPEEDAVVKAVRKAGQLVVYDGRMRPCIARRGIAKPLRAAPVAKAKPRPAAKPAPVRKSAPQDDRVRVCNRRGVMVGVTRQSAIRPVPGDTTSRVAKAALVNWVNVYNSAGRRVGIVPRDEVRIVKPGR